MGQSIDLYFIVFVSFHSHCLSITLKSSSNGICVSTLIFGCCTGICMLNSSNISGDAACSYSFDFTFVMIKFTECDSVASEANKSLFHKRFIFFSLGQNIYSRAQNEHLIENSYYLKERVFITFFLSREK